MTTVRRIVKWLWAAPCTLVGILLGALVRALGGSWAWRNGVIECYVWENSINHRGINLDINKNLRIAWAHRLASSLYASGFCAITFGHVVLSIDAKLMEQFRCHELAHVRQYEHWGILFFIAYPIAGIFALLKGKRYYWDNYFEVTARAAEHNHPPQKRL